MSLQNTASAKEKLSSTKAYGILRGFFDEDSFFETDALVKSGDGFAEVVTGYGTVEGLPVYAFAQNSDMQSGAMSAPHAEKIVKIYELAQKTGAPVVGFYDSTGGRLDEKNALLYAYGKVLSCATRISGVVPQVSVVLGNCLGSAALTAVSADFVIMSKNATLGIDTNGDSSSCDYNAKHGVAHLVCEDEEASIKKARELVLYLPSNNLSVSPVAEGVTPDSEASCNVCSVADMGSLLCINKDFSASSGTALGRINGQVVGFVSTKDKVIDCKAGQKIAKFVRFCDAFSIPIITFINSESFSSLKTSAKVAHAYGEATTAKLAVVTGTAVGSVYIALAGRGADSDMVFAFEDAVVSPIAPSAAAYIMDNEQMNVPKDEQNKLIAEYVENELSAFSAAQCGYIDDVVTKSELRDKLISALSMLDAKRVSTMPKKHSTI